MPLPVPAIEKTTVKNAETVKDSVPPHLYRTPSSPGFRDLTENENALVIDEVLNKSDLELGPENVSTDKSQDDLVSRIIHQSDDYRYITFNILENFDNYERIRGNYYKRVAFDTINIDVAKDKFDFDDEYALPLEIKKHNSEFNLSLFDNNRGRESMRSPSPLPRSPIHSPMRNSSRSRFYIAPRINYPTKPIITHRGCTYTRKHKNFEDLYTKKLFNKENGYLKPLLPLRTILVYISGRKHTWVALDWILNKFIEQGDTVVIVSAISHELKPRRKSGYSRISLQDVNSKDYRTRMRSRNRPENVKVIAQGIMNYAMEVVNPNIIAKISVELAVGKSREVLKEIYKLYEPNLVCTGTKPNMKRSAPLKSWTSSKISDRLVKNFPLPVIVVPAMKMNDFEDQLVIDINKRYSLGEHLTQRSTVSSSRNSEFSNLSKSDTSPTAENSNYTEDGSDTSSIDSDATVDSYSVFNEISKLYEEYKQTISKNMKLAQVQPYNEDYFANCLKVISDESTYLCQEIRNINPGYQGKGSTLAKAITGSNSFGVIPFKAKSLLMPLDETDNQKRVSAQSSNGPPGLSYKEMKRNLKLNTQKNQQLPVPHIKVETVSSANDNPHSEPPKSSALKFVDLETPAKDRSRNLIKSHKLEKFLSHDIDSSTHRPKIEQSRSHPDLTTIGQDNSQKSGDRTKKKKKKFLGLF